MGSFTAHDRAPLARPLFFIPFSNKRNQGSLEKWWRLRRGGRKYRRARTCSGTHGVGMCKGPRSHLRAPSGYSRNDVSNHDRIIARHAASHESEPTSMTGSTHQWARAGDLPHRTSPTTSWSNPSRRGTELATHTRPVQTGFPPGRAERGGDRHTAESRQGHLATLLQCSPPTWAYPPGQGTSPCSRAPHPPCPT